ncbi:MAG: GatB/YqeY domain-containing protein [Candidatus Goldiibacteriota bacterium]
MSLQEKINEDLKTSLKTKQQEKTAALRQIKSTAKNKEIKQGKPLSDEELEAVIFSLVKSHKESIKSFESGGRQDLAENEKKEMEVLESYLPKQLSDREIEDIVRDAVEKTGASSMKEMGKVMGFVMPKVKGKADGSAVNEAVKKILS